VFDSEDTNSQLLLLPPKPPWLLRMIAQVVVEPTATTTVTPKGKIKEPTSSGGKRNTHFLASALSAFYMHTQSPRTLLFAFSAVPSSPLSVSALAPPRTPVYVSVDIVLFFVLNTDWVTFSAGVTEQARSEGC